MTESLREQLLKLGFTKPEPKPVVETQLFAKPGANTQHGGGMPPRSSSSQSAQRPPLPAALSNAPRKPGQRMSNAPAQRVAPGPAVRPLRSQEEIDLARAYALRERQEREERERAKRDAEAKANERREKRLQLRTLLQGKSLNDAEADVMRHFMHGPKIKRVHVNDAQLQRLNAGELGVVQMEGRYLLVNRETALAVRLVSAEAVVLLPEPGEDSEDDWSQPPAESATT
ncbi:MAG: DUF2058 family protein [Pseudomonadota bacterium]|nr:DUF2058 family protein [Pseudomonadota bacterium]